MAEKLKLVRELIPWSLVTKGVLFGVAWLSLPFLLFLAVALFLFFSPPFQATRFTPIFIFVAWLSSTITPGVREAIFLAILFATALGIKNLIFVDRAFASQIFLATSSFLLWSSLFSIESPPGFSFLFPALLTILVIFLILRFLFQLGQPERIAPTPLFLMTLFSLLSLQFAWVLLLLPALPIAQAVFMALVAALFLELLFSYLGQTITPRKLLFLSSGVVLPALILILSLPFSLTP